MKKEANLYSDTFSQPIRAMFFPQVLKMNLLSETIASQTQRATTCSKTVEQIVKYVQSKQ